MKCTNKEQENCQVEKLGCKGCYYDEKSADEMFEELGYIKYDNHPPEEKQEPNKWVTQDCRVIEYTQTGTIKGMFYTLFIRFHIQGERVEVGASERREGYREIGRYRNPIFNVQELQAINKKVQELGWKG